MDVIKDGDECIWSQLEHRPQLKNLVGLRNVRVEFGAGIYAFPCCHISDVQLTN
jgi:hypothetical protein